MGDFKKNPRKPFEVKVPNNIRKRIAMHEKEDIGFSGGITQLLSPRIIPTQKKRGSMWSRFATRMNAFLGR